MSGALLSKSLKAAFLKKRPPWGSPWKQSKFYKWRIEGTAGRRWRVPNYNAGTPSTLLNSL
jgi:hypothetical protein